MMNPIYRIWWRLLMDLRPITRYSAERLPPSRPGRCPFPHASPTSLSATSSRSLVSVYGVGGVGVARIVPVGLRSVGDRGGVGSSWCSSSLVLDRLHAVLVWLVGWREAWRIRRRWPSDWAVRCR